MADWLSQYNLIKSSVITPSSLRSLLTHVILQDTSAMALYSDSAEERETVCCFLVFHETGESPRNGMLFQAGKSRPKQMKGEKPAQDRTAILQEKQDIKTKLRRV